MKIVVHAGMAKTGSSAIQKTLSSNRDALWEQGIIYPYLGPEDPASFERWNSHWLLIANIHPDPLSYHHLVRKTDEKRERFMSIKVLDILEEILAAAKDDEVVVLSAENFGRQATAGGLENILIPLLKKYTSDIHCVAYARPPASHYPSSIQQHLKSGRTELHSPSEWTTPHYPQHKTLKRLFGDGYTLRIFSRDALYKNDVIDDFFQYLNGLSRAPLTFEKMGDTNVSYSAGACAIMFRFMSSRPDIDRKKFRTLKHELTKFDATEPQKKFSVPSEWSAAIHENNATAWNSMVADVQHPGAEKDQFVLPENKAVDEVNGEAVAKHFMKSFDQAYMDKFIEYLQKNDNKKFANVLSRVITES